MMEETVRCDSPKLLPSSLINKVRKRLKNETYKSNYVRIETLLRDFLICEHCGINSELLFLINFSF